MEKKLPCVFMVGGLLYGDEGKGTTVEYLVKHTNSKLVVRYGGGPQAAHHVVLPNGTWHCFSQYGSGGFFQDCYTLLGKYMLIYPLTLMRELDVLKNKGVKNVIERLYIDKECFLITPYHQLLNRICEIYRRGKIYGSTGLGVGIATDEAYFSYPEFFVKGKLCYEIDKQILKSHNCLQIKDLFDEKILFNKIQNIVIEKIQQVQSVIENKVDICDKEYSKLHECEQNFENVQKEAFEIFLNCINNHTVNSLYNYYLNFYKEFKNCFVDGCEIIEHNLSKGKDIIFEGSQGSLLDRIYGIYPHVTKCLCSDDNGKELLNNIKVSHNFKKIGVLRTYSSRHGAGPFITHTPELENIIKEQHNQNSKWQGNFKIGHFDLVAAKYGIRIFQPDFISLTCIDQISKLEENDIKICIQYSIRKSNSSEIYNILNKKDLFDISEDDNNIYINEIKIRNDEDAYKSYDLLKILKDAKPVYKEFESYEIDEIKLEKELDVKEKKYISLISKLLGKSISILSFGPTINDKILVSDI